MIRIRLALIGDQLRAAVMTFVWWGVVAQIALAADTPDTPDTSNKVGTADKSAAKPIAWQTSREAGVRDAQANKRPLLIRFGGEACPWCRRLDEEIAKPAVQSALKNWTLVTLDVEKHAADARALNIESIPALRVLSSTGRLLESRDGYLPADKLVDWLNQSFERATEAPDEALLSTGTPAPVELQKIIRQFADRNPAAREAAIRRLMPHPADAAEAVISAMRQEKLSVRLAALELLREWKAPLDDLDPWRPETLTAERFTRLEEWLSTIATKEAAPWSLTPAALTDARVDIDQMLKADAATAAAVRERLARHKTALLPEVVTRLKDATTDDERTRLLALRYRLVMDDALALRSPELVERLAAGDVRTRHQAVQELTEQAGPESQPLFLELFADADPLVRELSLHGLRTAAGDQGTNALVKLLDDPEPNVRAAVLKQLAENPWPELQPRLAEFLKTEQETALLVHAVRCFRKLKAKSPGVLIPLLEHAEWQVRAETLDTLTGAWQRYPDTETQQLMKNEAVRSAVVARLDDEDAFVVSRAIIGVKSDVTLAVITKLLLIPEKHPSMTKEVVATLSTASGQKPKVMPALKTFAASPDPTVRAEAIHGLGHLGPQEIEPELLMALQDEESQVRIASAKTLQEILAQSQPRLSNGRWQQANSPNFAADDSAPSLPSFDVPEPPAGNEGFLSGLIRNLVGGAQPRSVRPPVAGPVAPAIKVRPADDATKTETAKADLSKRALELGTERDEWLVQFRKGNDGPGKFGMMIAPLEKMFASSSASERIASAVPLVALGNNAALPQVAELASSGGSDAADVLRVLKWLPFAEREKIYAQLVSLPKAKDLSHELLTILPQSHDIRDVDFVWTLCDLPGIAAGDLAGFDYALRQIYFGERYWDTSTITAGAKRRVSDSAMKQLDSPPGWRRLMLVILMHESLPAKPEDEELNQIRTAAQSLADDKSLPKDLSADALQIVLLTVDRVQQSQRLLELLQTGEPSQRLLALRCLTNEGHGLGTLMNSHISLNERNAVARMTPRGEQIQPKPPHSVTPDMVRPLLTSPDAETRALAGYVLAVSAEPGGLPPLLDYWRAHGKGDEQWGRLVYRAIAVNDESQYLPVLKQIYKQLEDYRVNEFYWTIRIMTGPKVLEFRKQIRAEKGAEALR